MQTPDLQKVKFDFIRYANCWEDADILCEALQPAPGKRIFSIASGGDNAFALLAEGAEVLAADLNPAQLTVVELKAAAIRTLERDDLLAFLGIHPASNRPETYQTLRNTLGPGARTWWDTQPDAIARGIIHAGKFERFLRTFGQRVLPLVHRRRTIDALMHPRSPEERITFYRNTWDNRRWRALFKIAMSRRVLGRGGRDPAFFQHVEGPVSARLLSRVGRAFETLPLEENPWLDYILHGNFTRALPRYLRPGILDAVRKNLDRLTLAHGPAGNIPDAGTFDGFNLSDIFEYLDPDACRDLYGALLTQSNPGARLAYWNMLAPRAVPEALADRVTPLTKLAADGFARDGAFFYSDFVVEEVK
ncbi:MAG: DUF3419 family protein [Verrucomicrobia bacterium]|nr:DUF3419 family protein [Verrucomicrobiota bacterium]